MLPARLRIVLSVSCFALVLFACSPDSGPPTTTASGGADRQGELQPPETPQETLLELSYVGGMIANPDPTPFVRVFAGGRVVVHYPVYMKKAGDYTLNLDEEELKTLLASFSNEAVLTLQDDDLLLMAEELQADGSQPQIRDHGVQSVVRIRGESVTPAGSTGPAIINVDHTIQAPSNLLQAAADSPFENLKALAVGVHALEELARSESLEKIE